jgi:hypothetical protein
LGDTSSRPKKEEDRISALIFDPSGTYLSLGDNDGRLILFKYSLDEDGYPHLSYHDEIDAF